MRNILIFAFDYDNLTIYHTLKPDICLKNKLVLIKKVSMYVNLLLLLSAKIFERDQIMQF